MQDILTTLESFFVSDDWQFERLAEHNALRMGFSGTVGQWTCFAQARQQQQQFVFYSIPPFRAPEDRRAAMAEFVTRANYGMILGNFEMDFNDGEVRFKTSIDTEDAELTPALIKHLVYANVTMMDRYYSGIVAVAHGGADPAEAIAAIEQS
jgi:hypothetical protein